MICKDNSLIFLPFCSYASVFPSLIPPCLTGSSQISGDWVSVGSWPVSLGSSRRQRAQEQEEKPEATFRRDGERWWWKVTKARYFRGNKGRLVSLIKLIILIKISLKCGTNAEPKNKPKFLKSQNNSLTEVIWKDIKVEIWIKLEAGINVHSFPYFWKLHKFLKKAGE